MPNWDQASQKKVRDALLVLGSTTSGFKNAFGPKGKVDPINHLIGTAMGWGGNPEQGRHLSQLHAGQERRHDGLQAQGQGCAGRGFWSISLYNAEGFFEKNEYNAYSVNNITAKKSPDGAVDDPVRRLRRQDPNCLPIMKGWNYTVRLYRPREAILDGKWKFPEARPVN